MNTDHLESIKTPFHVLIIGGGIGGLCLAQGLKQSGISVAVYERDRSVHFRSQGYRIGINTDGGRALYESLPENLFSLFVATSARPITGRLTIFDPHLKERFSRPLPPAVADLSFLLNATQTAPYTGVNRLTLRELLLHGLDGIVHFDKTFQRFEQVGSGQVRAYFADGTSAQEISSLVPMEAILSSASSSCLMPHLPRSVAPFMAKRHSLPKQWSGFLTIG